MKKLTFLILAILTTSYIFAQNDIDAFRYSQNYPEGTARSMAMGNAFGAIGADISSAIFNPAGIGMFNHTEFMYSPSLLIINSMVDYNGTKVISSRLPFYGGDFGMVLNLPSKSSNIIKDVNLSLGYNRTNNFKNNYNLQGINDKGSMLDYFMLRANGNIPEQLDQFSSFLAWDTWLLDTIPGDNTLYTNPLWFASYPNTPKYGQKVTRYNNQYGSAGEWYFNSGINIKDFFYIGATIGLPTFHYEETITHTESNFKDSTDLNNFSYKQTIIDDGSGFNFKIGVILKPFNFIRIGASLATPTYLTINDTYSTSIESHWNTPDTNGVFDYSQSSPDNIWNYHVSTPLVIHGNLGLNLLNFALVGFDYELVNYNSMFMSAQDYLFTTENATIDSTYGSATNLRAGLELNFGAVKLRGGYALFGNPYNISGQNFSRNQISAGIGFTGEHFYLDFAYVLTKSTFKTYLYNGYIDEPVPNVANNTSTINMTIGFKF